MGAYALVQWREIPPKWDVVSCKDIKRGPLEEGAHVLVQFEKDIFEAKILQLGKWRELCSDFCLLFLKFPQLAHETEWFSCSRHQMC